MAGRGFLKSLVVKQKAKAECEESSKSTNTTVSILHNGIHHQDHDKALNKAVQMNGVAKTSVPVLTNGVQIQLNRGRGSILAKVNNQEDMILETKTGLSSLKIANRVISQPVPRSEVCKIDAKLTPVITQSDSMVSLHEQSMDTELQKEAPLVEFRVPPVSTNDNYVMKPLSANYIKLDVDENKGLYEYLVTLNPTVEDKSMQQYLINQHRELFPVKLYYDNSLFVPTMLSNEVTVLKAKLKNESEVTIKITFKAKRNLKESINFYNVFLHSIFKTIKLIKCGQHFYNPDKKIRVEGYQLEVWPGFITAINEFEGGLLMCCDIGHRLLRLDTALDVMTNIARQKKYENDGIKENLMVSLCGKTIITRYNNKTYRIDDIEFESNPTSTFDQGGKIVSYVDYYKNYHNIHIQDLKQPLIISKLKKNNNQGSLVYLVPELCNLTGLSEKMKSDFKLTSTVNRYTKVTPDVRQSTLVDLMESINNNNACKRLLENWGLKFQPVLIDLVGPVYKREFIRLKNNTLKQVGSNMEWTLDVVKNSMFRAVNIRYWALLYLSTDRSTATNFYKQLQSYGKVLGMFIDQPKLVEVHNSKPDGFFSAIQNVVQINNQLELIVIIFPNIREDLYNAVKKICCANIGIPSQVIISRTLSNPSKLKSITPKIALQINCKLGGACWAVDIPLKNTMIIGIDAYHESKRRTNSVIGFVASMNLSFTQWYSRAIIPKSTYHEYSSDLYLAMSKALNKFKEINLTLPDKIIVYRDGISLGDAKNVEELELNQLENSLKIYSNEYSPKITFITVQKRINTKIFQVYCNEYSNPCSGTVVDNTITRKNMFDFYLVSQHVRQGTVNPTHYIVWKNGCNLSVENIQRLSYKLCHMYYNWCGTIKVPAPIQYAHKLAYLIGENVKQLPKENLSDTLFYL